MYYIILFLPMLAAMIWALHNEFKRRFLVGSVALSVCSVLVMVRFVVVALHFGDVAVAPLLDTAEKVASLYLIPIMYAYLCDQCGTSWTNRASMLMFILPLLTLFDNPVIELGYSVPPAHEAGPENTLSVFWGTRLLAQCSLRSLVVDVQCVIVMIRMVVLWFRVKDFGLKFSRRLTIYFAWMFLLLGFTIFTFSASVHLTDALGMKWAFCGVYSVIITLGYVLVPHSFSVRPLVTIDQGEPVRLDRFVENNRHLASLLRRELIENKAYLKQGFHIDDMAALIGTNRTYVSKMMREEFCQTFTDFVNSARLEHSKQLLLTTEQSLDDVAEHSGYTSAAAFCRSFKRATGLSPGEWRNQNQK